MLFDAGLLRIKICHPPHDEKEKEKEKVDAGDVSIKCWLHPSIRDDNCFAYLNKKRLRHPALHDPLTLELLQLPVDPGCRNSEARVLRKE